MDWSRRRVNRWAKWMKYSRNWNLHVLNGNFHEKLMLWEGGVKVAWNPVRAHLAGFY